MLFDIIDGCAYAHYKYVRQSDVKIIDDITGQVIFFVDFFVSSVHSVSKACSRPHTSGENYPMSRVCMACVPRSTHRRLFSHTMYMQVHVEISGLQ